MPTPMTQPVFSHQQAHASGWTMHDLTREVEAGRLVRVRRGYYAQGPVPEDVLRAVRVGGAPTAATALRLHGVWTAPDERLHVWMPAHAGRRHNPDKQAGRPVADGLCIHYTAHLARDRTPMTFEPLPALDVALAHAAECWPVEFTVAAADSAVQSRLLTMTDVARIRGAVPGRHRSAFARVDGSAGSGIESIARCRLLDAGFEVRTQVQIPRVGRVDLLVNGRVVIELDGREFHDDPGQFERDRDRDLQLRLQGYVVLRFTYWQVLREWPSVLAAVALATTQAA